MKHARYYVKCGRCRTRFDNFRAAYTYFWAHPGACLQIQER